jgi:chromatin-remodeling ATPase INO80
MTGAPPYGIHSPTQQSPYTVYSPPSKSRAYYPSNEQYQHPPDTQAFPPPSAFARSPHFAHPPSPLSTTLPPLNGSVPPSHPDPSSAYPPQHAASGAPQFTLPRPYAGSVLAGNTPTPYGQATPSHARPSAGSEALLQSPKKETEPPFDIRGNGVGYSPQPPMIREIRPASPKETVSV